MKIVVVLQVNREKLGLEERGLAGAVRVGVVRVLAAVGPVVQELNTRVVEVVVADKVPRA